MTDWTEPAYRNFVGSRRRLIPLLAGGVVFAAVGIVMLINGQRLGWLVAGFFGLAVAVSATSLVRPDRLSLTANGFTSTGLAGQRRALVRTWDQCGEFRLLRINRVGFAVYNSSGADTAIRRLNRWLADGDEAIKLGFAGITDDELVAMLNRYRAAAISI